MAEVIGVVVIIALCLVALWVGAMILVGAVSTWEDWGLVVLLGWIFAFPFMLVICFLVGLSQPRSSATTSAPKVDSPSASSSSEDNYRAVEAAGVELVSFFEERHTEQCWSRYAFREWAQKLKLLEGEWIGRSYFKHPEWEYVPSPCVKQWQSFSRTAHDSFIRRLPYPEYVQSDLDSAINSSISEADFKARHKDLIAAFDGVYTRKKEWIEQESQTRQRKLEREQKRQKVRTKLLPRDTGTPD
jgi:hypothetical protein